ncbi:LysR family transcriptional regulator [Vibrio anguillarum]|jgi:DNA-binding transcriptional LysR family regulator|uniref:LysR family transcriptional regulator n=4 Tax=Gammaproteobacteria TaxID=1236 RepID=A0A1Q1J2C1_VIBAN|nr:MULTISPECIES: LysR family transcriptional regulator [Vibrio]OXX70764.1 LysR family transcriptional regulator [Vibrio sp. V03_P4A6T147]AEH35098.1 Transcriptional regulator, LysR family [Vibrio anguillarum 775]AGU59631.1 LysR family transcriptional regulator [Vibrio anguillarum M3]AQM21357.1 LysR family transcriptional regulator [Vibrio anguillarum]AQP37930.1 LysR family transcriptional regulator [Vibrio anguillarum]
MNLSQIEAFFSVADTGSVSEAARQLECNRTKLSMAIKALEKELDTALFVRTGNNLTLSEAGKAIYKDCESVLVTIARIKHTCTQISRGFNAEMWIARDDSLPDALWQDFAHQLNNRFPATSFNLVLASSGDLANLIATHQVDFAFGVDYERINDPRITYQPLGKIRMMSVCKSDHPLTKISRVTDEELRRAMQAVMVYLNEKDNPELQPFSRRYIGFSSFDYMLNTILTENAWGVLPEPLIRHFLREQKLTVIKHTYGLTQEDYCMFTATGMAEHPGMNWLADKLRDYLFDF